MSARMPAFYNPRMTTSRDVAVLCASAYAQSQRSGILACDLLSATGIRGLRYLAVPGVAEVHLNDIGKTAYRLIRKNLELNYKVDSLDQAEGITVCRVDGKVARISNLEARHLLAQHKREYHLLDLDPFGSPAKLVEPSLKSLRHGSMLCATATDTAALCGTYPRTCLRRYGSLPLKTEYKHEVGLRILIAFIARRAASMEMACTPLFCHATGHYYRVYLSAMGSRSRADRALQNVGWALHCGICGRRATSSEFLPPREECCGEEMVVFGPLWISETRDTSFLSSVISANRPEFNVGAEARRLLEHSSEEIDVFSYHDLHFMSRSLGLAAPRTSRVVQILRESGHQASGTHITGTGVKTTADISEIRDAVIEAAKG